MSSGIVIVSAESGGKQSHEIWPCSTIPEPHFDGERGLILLVVQLAWYALGTSQPRTGLESNLRHKLIERTALRGTSYNELLLKVI